MEAPKSKTGLGFWASGLGFRGLSLQGNKQDADWKQGRPNVSNDIHIATHEADVQGAATKQSFRNIEPSIFEVGVLQM